MSTFAQYKTKPKRGTHGHCTLCDEPVSGRVVVTLQERYEDPKRTSRDANRVRYPSIDSTSRGYCERHAVEVYENAKAKLDGGQS